MNKLYYLFFSQDCIWLSFSLNFDTFKSVVHAVLISLKTSKTLWFDFSGNTHSPSASHSFQMRGDNISTAGINKEEWNYPAEMSLDKFTSKLKVLHWKGAMAFITQWHLLQFSSGCTEQMCAAFGEHIIKMQRNANGRAWVSPIYLTRKRQTINISQYLWCFEKQYENFSLNSLTCLKL